MKTFHCTHCENLVFFENVVCLNCRHDLAFLPDAMQMAALEPGGNGRCHYDGREYKPCANSINHQICNWALPAADANELCSSCRLTHIIPDLSQPGNLEAWHRLETSKRRLLYTLLALGLPVTRKSPSAPNGVEFEFLSDTPRANGDQSRVMTGHDNGVITINVAEADDVYREQERTRQNEPYRTLLGHFRHESGHYYWDQLVRNTARLDEFRELFGDERASYREALDRHYREGAPANWEREFVSAYASTHPWEDWAESWAHVLHMIDALETAASLGVCVNPRRSDEPALSAPPQVLRVASADFESMIAGWLSLIYVLNNFTRGLGLPDSYPFVLSQPVIRKLRFVYETIGQAGHQ